MFGLLPPISQAARVPFHLPYFRLILRSLLIPSPSQRGAAKGKTVPANQENAVGELPADVAEKLVVEYWAAYDDLRLFFFREVAALIAKGEVATDAVLTQLAPLTNLPKVQGDINAFFLPGLDLPPASNKRAKVTKDEKKKSKKGKELDALPEWMETYESESDEEVGTKRKRERASALGTHAAVHSLAAHTNAYTTAWEEALGRLELGEGWTRRILASLHGERGILAHWAPARRVRLADWLGGTVDAGGAHALLAMNGLFVLMTTYNLDYPKFYERLYALLDGEVLHARYRARFFRLLDTFLRSPLLSASLVAAFIKRLARLALSAPPAGAILVVPFVYNLFKRHPGTMAMLHRLADDAEEDDPYDENEPVPGKSRAIESSAWELAAIKGHYLASVGTMAKIFSEQFTKPEFNLEDFLDHGYGTVSSTKLGIALTPSSLRLRRSDGSRMPRPSASSLSLPRTTAHPCSLRLGPRVSATPLASCGRSRVGWRSIDMYELGEPDASSVTRPLEHCEWLCMGVALAIKREEQSEVILSSQRLSEIMRNAHSPLTM